MLVSSRPSFQSGYLSTHFKPESSKCSFPSRVCPPFRVHSTAAPSTIHYGRSFPLSVLNRTHLHLLINDRGERPASQLQSRHSNEQHNVELDESRIFNSPGFMVKKVSLKQTRPSSCISPVQGYITIGRTGLACPPTKLDQQ
jgi:hypothetical protein